MEHSMFWDVVSSWSLNRGSLEFPLFEFFISLNKHTEIWHTMIVSSIKGISSSVNWQLFCLIDKFRNVIDRVRTGVIHLHVLPRNVWSWDPCVRCPTGPFPVSPVPDLPGEVVHRIEPTGSPVWTGGVIQRLPSLFRFAHLTGDFFFGEFFFRDQYRWIDDVCYTLTSEIMFSWMCVRWVGW